MMMTMTVIGLVLILASYMLNRKYKGALVYTVLYALTGAGAVYLANNLLMMMMKG